MPREEKSSSPSKKHSEKRRAGRSHSRRKEKSNADDDEETVVVTPEHSSSSTTEKNSFDLSSAIASVREGIWVSAVSGTRMGSSLEAALLENGVTAVVSTLEKPQKTETFEQHTVSSCRNSLRALHDACDFVNQALSEGGSVFVHSKSGFSRSERATLVVLGYMIKYENVKLSECIESLSSTAKHPVSVSLNFRRDLAQFENECLGETSVSEEWILGEEEEGRGNKNHSLSRRKLAENLNDRRLLKKKSPHK